MVSFLLALLLTAPPAAPGRPGATAAQPPPAWDLLWTIDPPDGSPRKPRPPASRALATLGRTLYQGRCASCHGDKGDGQSPLARQLTPAPTAFTRAVFKLRSTPPGALPTDEDLFRTLTRGMHGTAMQPWRRLSERERWALVDQIKSFSPRFASATPPPAIDVPPPPREKPDLLERGEILYLRHACGTCHGTEGQGKAPARDFTRGRFIRGAEMQDLYLTLKVGIAGTAMPSYSALPDEELWALAAYVRVLVRERPLEDFPPAGSTQARDEHAPGAWLPERP